jgi:CRISPR-associated protein Csm3
MANKLLKKIEFQGKLVLKTGLHIGGTNSSMQIGGIDKSVIRNPLTNQPFIPGSSFKGKMRSLFEVSIGQIGGSVGNVSNGPANSGPSSDLYGNATNDRQKPSRLIVRDCSLKGAINLSTGQSFTIEEFAEKTEIPFTEGKTEVVIDRITSAANPRQIERVPAGAVFSLNMVLNIWEQDNNESTLIDNLFKSLELLKDDYLGGHGSRGYGQISIEIDQVLEKSTDDYFGKENSKPKDRTDEFSIRITKLKS